MSDLNKALGDISSIRMQVARSTDFRGYGPATLAATGILALAAATAQWRWLLNPERRVGIYLATWISTAVLSAAVIGAEMFARTRRMHRGMADKMIRMAVEQFLPSVAAGLLMTIVLVRYVSSAEWMLPGVWQVIFSLGVFASCRFLPRPMIAAGVWYLITGAFCISLGDARAFSPWAMGIPYGVGQLIVAGVLFHKAREARDEG
jgi:hypothetical protein